MVSCEEDFLLHRDPFKPSVTVNSIFTVGQPWIVNLSFSRDILENQSQIKTILNAEVIVVDKNNGRQILLNHTGNGIYTSKIYPAEPDKNYELQVMVPGFEKVTATSMSPQNAQVVKIISEDYDPKTTKVNFEIQNSANSYYIWNLVFTNKNNPIDTTYTGNPKNLVGSIKNYNNLSGYLSTISNPGSNDGSGTGGQFSTYNNSTLDSEGDDGGESGASGSDPVKKKYLRLVTASKELYNYYKTIEKFIEVENHNSSFSQTPGVYSNIQNGLGIFAGYTEKYIEIKN